MPAAGPGDSRSAWLVEGDDAILVGDSAAALWANHCSSFDHDHVLADLSTRFGAVLEAIFLYNTSEREAMMPRKPFPHPELEKQQTAPIPGIYPNAVPPEK